MSAPIVSQLEAVLGEGGRLSADLPGYEHRPGQLEMARRVQYALDRDETLLVEAGTGTGKTLAYLVPALLSGKKVVISTGTKALQDQIMEHDLPLLSRVLGGPLPVTCMKGLSNYVCRRRLREFRGSAEAAVPPLSRQLPAVDAWLATTDTGDRNELDALPGDAPIWAEIGSGADTRIGPKCAHYDECFVTAMRKRAEQAQVVVVNHHLFFADLALRGPHGAGALPEYDAVVFDEAHLIEDVATDFFGVHVSTMRLQVLVRDATRALGACGLLPDAESLLSQVNVRAAAFFAALPRTSAEGGRVPLPASEFSDRVKDPMYALDTALDALSAFCKGRVGEVEHGEAVAQVARRADQVRDDVATIAEGGQGGQVTWTLSRGRRVSIGASPVQVGEILREHLFYRGLGLVLTSATLSTGGSFEFLRRRLGIDFEVDEAVVESPFDYPAQAALYVPGDMPDPRSGQYLQRATGEIAGLCELTRGGAFVLCTSLRMMRLLSEQLRPRLGRPLYVQGEAPAAALLSRFRQDGDAVLVATMGFWQGVDVPGRALRLVVIDKLPFDVPTDPLVSARCEALQAEGLQPFMKYLVPAAALTLKQGFGRLIRARSDRGIVAILDGRIAKKGYGKVFLRSLPPARRCRTMAEVGDFWADGGDASRQ
ncbi:MAG: ATP-dependent DNA helicase [Myxococcales bacterium]